MLRCLMRKKYTRIGLFGGTFNPIHVGHIQIMRRAKELGSLDVIYCIPTGFAPHKDNAIILPFDERCSHIQSKLAHEESIFLSTIESELTIPSYTFRTLQYFTRSFPYSEQFFICGSADFLTIDSWEQGENILQHTNYIIAPRSTVAFEDVRKYIEKYTHIENIEEEENKISIYSTYAMYIYMCIPMIPISSTEIRAMKRRDGDNERAN